MTNWFYHLMDKGVYWSVDAASFADFSAIPEGANVIPVPDRAYLVDVLKQYGFELGELAGPDDLLKRFHEEIAKSLDAFAQEKQYDNMDKARLAALTADFRADGEFANQLYDRVWTTAFVLEEEVRGGSLSVEAAIKKLPEMKWPERGDL